MIKFLKVCSSSQWPLNCNLLIFRLFRFSFDKSQNFYFWLRRLVLTIADQNLFSKKPLNTRLDSFCFVFIYIPNSFSAFDSFKKHSTHVVLGPYDDAIALATEAFNIAYITTTSMTSPKLNCTYEILPSLDKFSQAIFDLVKKYKWEKVSVFFDDEKGIQQL